MTKPSPRVRLVVFLVVALSIMGACQYQGGADFPGVSLLRPLQKATPVPSPTRTVSPTITPTATTGPTNTDTPTEPATETVGPSDTPTVTDTPAPSSTPAVTFTPWPSAPLCASHSITIFHTLWNGAEGCHYDHEHGQNPFVPEVANAFPGFDLQALLGGVQVGHTNPSSPIENTDKHGGNKWNVQLVHPQTCAGFEGAATGVNGSVVQFHGFGDYAIEAEVRIHSTMALLRQCKASDPTDYGFAFINQLQDYGQRVVPYQGTIVAYPNQPQPPFESRAGPYLSFDCLDLTAPHVPQCRSSFEQALANIAGSNWAAGVGYPGHSDAPNLFRPLWRVGDIYRLFDWNDQSHPFTWLWLCSTDGGFEFNPIGCRYNNSTTQVHEIEGVIPVEWDNLAGFDTDTRVGRITGEGYTTGAGTLTLTCSTPGMDCYPIKLVSAFTGTYGSVLVYTPNKGTNIVPYLPDRDIHFCDGVVCAETDAGAVASGWIGSQN